MTSRILLSGNRVIISRPGVDALAPPAYTPEYLMMDSQWNDLPASPLLQIIPHVGVTVGNASTFNFGATYPYPPIMTVIEFQGATVIKSVDYGYANVGGDNWFTPVYWDCTTSKYTLRAMGPFYNGHWAFTPKTFAVFVWKAW